MSVGRIGIATSAGADGANVDVKEISVTSNAASGALISMKNISGTAVSINDRGLITLDHDGIKGFFFKAGGGGGSEGNMWIEFTDTDAHKFYVAVTAASGATDILVETMQGAAGGATLDGAGAASGKVTLVLHGTGPTSWDLTTPDGQDTGQSDTTPLTSIAIGAHTWSNIGITTQATLPAGTALPGAW